MRTPNQEPARAQRLLGPALILGGVLWITIFCAIIVNGMQTGSLPTSAVPDLGLVMAVALRLFVASIPILVAGLAALLVQTWRRAKILGSVGAVFGAIALLLSTANLVTLSGLAGTPRFSDTFMGLSVFATALASGFLATAALRTRALQRRATYALLFVGVTTIPVLFGTPLPIGPDWATDYLAFLLSGVAFVGAGLSLVGARRAGSSSTTAIEPAT